MSASASADPGPRSTVAIISYMIIGIFTGALIGIFFIICLGITVKTEMIGLLSTMLTATVAGLAAIAGFWLAGAQSQQKPSNAATTPVPAGGTVTTTVEPAVDEAKA